MMKTTSSESSNKLVRLDGRGVMLLPDFAKEIEMKLEDNSGSTRTQIVLEPNSTRIETALAQPTFGLCNASSTYRQMIKSIYENSLDQLLHGENSLAIAS